MSSLAAPDFSLRTLARPKAGRHDRWIRAMPLARKVASHDCERVIPVSTFSQERLRLSHLCAWTVAPLAQTFSQARTVSAYSPAAATAAATACGRAASGFTAGSASASLSFSRAAAASRWRFHIAA